MKLNIQAIIFDWGGVFVDPETKQYYPEGDAVLGYCKLKGYRLGLVVIASKFEERKKQIEESHLRNFFETFHIGSLTTNQIWDPDFLGKDTLYEDAVSFLQIPRNEILIIDDRMVRGIRYANQNGHPSVWIQKGKFAHETPNETTGKPTHRISSLSELVHLI